MDIHHGNGFAKDFIGADGMSEVRMLKRTQYLPQVVTKLCRYLMSRYESHMITHFCMAKKGRVIAHYCFRSAQRCVHGITYLRRCS